MPGVPVHRLGAPQLPEVRVGIGREFRRRQVGDVPTDNDRHSHTSRTVLDPESLTVRTVS